MHLLPDKILLFYLLSKVYGRDGKWQDSKMKVEIKNIEILYILIRFASGAWSEWWGIWKDVAPKYHNSCFKNTFNILKCSIHYYTVYTQRSEVNTLKINAQPSISQFHAYTKRKFQDQPLFLSCTTFNR